MGQLRSDEQTETPGGEPAIHRMQYVEEGANPNKEGSYESVQFQMDIATCYGKDEKAKRSLTRVGIMLKHAGNGAMWR